MKGPKTAWDFLHSQLVAQVKLRWNIYQRPPASLRLAAVMHEGQDTTPAHFISAPLHGLVGTDRWGLSGKWSGRPMPPREGAAHWGADARRDEWCLDKCCSQCHLIQWELAAGRSRFCSNYLLCVRWVGLKGSVCVCVCVQYVWEGGRVKLKAPLLCF